LEEDLYGEEVEAESSPKNNMIKPKEEAKALVEKNKSKLEKLLA
jgi:hypothetical protein